MSETPIIPEAINRKERHDVTMITSLQYAQLSDVLLISEMPFLNHGKQNLKCSDTILASVAACGLVTYNAVSPISTNL